MQSTLKTIVMQIINKYRINEDFFFISVKLNLRYVRTIGRTSSATLE